MLNLDRVQRLFGSGWFWNDQPHAYNRSGCIPPSLQCYKGHCNALNLDRIQRLFGSGWFWNDQPHVYNWSNTVRWIEILQWCTQVLLLFLGHLEDMTLTHYTLMAFLLEQSIHLDLCSNKLIINTSLTWTTFYFYLHATKNVLELGLCVPPFHDHTNLCQTMQTFSVNSFC